MPETRKVDPVSKFRFEVVSASLKGGFSKVTGIKEEIAVEDKRNGTEPLYTRKMKGEVKGGQLTLERGVVKDFDLFRRWYARARSGKQAYREIVEIQVKDEEDNIVRRLKAIEAWPISYEISDLDAKASDVAVETITLVFDWIQFSLATTGASGGAH